ncbi:hypothetical protein AVEN_234409-1 [Araneus ventricosus]|uniref:Uncharacterized protein n=1 Tax=Araneus ventricosus TaxID=182803 RepID=A0A4Y2A9W2_ARAVE|nr:hypothetical protein AVEN_234409-1 [Araneus ventricosus]
MTLKQHRPESNTHRTRQHRQKRNQAGGPLFIRADTSIYSCIDEEGTLGATRNSNKPSTAFLGGGEREAFRVRGVTTPVAEVTKLLCGITLSLKWGELTKLAVACPFFTY